MRTDAITLLKFWIASLLEVCVMVLVFIPMFGAESMAYVFLMAIVVVSAFILYIPCMEWVSDRYL